MTCKAMGGPCNTILQGETSADMIAAGQKHLNDMSKRDIAHKKSKRLMDKAMSKADFAKKWLSDFEVKFAQMTANTPI